MRYLFLLLLFCSLLSRGGEKHYLFCYFTDNGQDGLHLAHSADGLKWEVLHDGKSFLKPNVGQDKLMRDPYILQGADGTFHMVWTCSWKERQIGYASSKDLVNWSEQKAIPVMDKEPTAKNCWAPEMVYDKKNKNYVIFWATTIPGRHSDVTNSEGEKGWNHRIYCTTTTDFVKFSPTRLFFNPDFSVIDATILRKKNIYYMFLKNENPNPPEKNIRITYSSSASGPYPTQVSPPITGNYWAEGPSALEVGKYVYLYFDKYRDNKYGAVRSMDMKNWEDVSESIFFPAGVRHGTAFQVSDKIFNELINTKQLDYHILVADSKEKLDKNVGNSWDSKIVKEDRSIRIAYAGEALISGKKYFWKVRIKDQAGNESDWSEIAWFQMGLLSASDWGKVHARERG